MWNGHATVPNRRLQKSRTQCDFGLRGFQFERRIPRATVGAIETRSQRMRVAERRIDDGRVRDSGEQLLWSDARQASTLSMTPIVCHVVQFDNRTQVRRVVRNQRKNTVAPVKVPRRD